MRKRLCIVLILLICFSFNFYYVHADEEEEENNNTTNNTIDIYEQRNEIKNQIDSANTQLEQVQVNLTENLQQIEKLDQKIEEAETKLAEQESKIAKLKNSIAETTDKLDVATQKYLRQKELFKERLVAIYEAGDTQYLDILLKSKSLTDFISNYFILSELAELDNDIMNELEQKKITISQSKQKLEKERDELTVVAENQTRLARTLQNTRLLRQNFVEKLSEEEKTLQAKIDEYNAEYDKINKEILSLSLAGLSTKYIGGELAWPTPGYTLITSAYGYRNHPILGVTKMHTGVDIGAPLGANFVAANDGVVLKAAYNGNYGNMVLIDHGGGITTLYAHGSEILVQPGENVTRGQPVLKIGSTGLSTGPHAHFEVRINGVTTNPLPYITNGLVPGNEETTEVSN